MGIIGDAAGFDMVPPLDATSTDDKTKWAEFIDAVENKYMHDPMFQWHPTHYKFRTGEYMLLPMKGHKFRRFAIALSGPHIDVAEDCFYDVFLIAEKYFGDRIRRWRTDSGNAGERNYSWEEVDKTIASFEEEEEDKKTADESKDEEAGKEQVEGSGKDVKSSAESQRSV